MKIRNVEMKNFRNHKETNMVFKKTNFIIGGNNSGKSSVKGALQLALTGKNDWTGTRNFKDLISHEATEGFVSVEVDGLGIIDRFVREKGSYIELNSSKLPERELEKELKENFNLSFDVIDSVMSSSRFLEMKEAEQKNFLFRLTGGSLDVSKVVTFMDKPSDEAKAVVNKHLSGKVDIDDLDALYSDLFAERRHKKKVRDDLKTKMDISDAVASHSGIDIDAVKRELTDVKEKKNALIKRIAVAKERAKQKKNITKYLTEVKERIKILEEKVDKSIDIAKSEETIFDYITEINSLETKLDAKKEVISVRKSSVKNFEAMLKKLSTPNCPLSDRLVCTADKAPLTKEFESEIVKNKKEIEKASEEVVRINKSLTELKEKKKTIEVQVKLSADLHSLKEQEKSLEKDIKAIKVEDVAHVSSEIEKIDARIEALNKDTNTHQEWVKSKAAFDKLIKDLSLAEKDYSLYEYLVKEFGPKGVKSRILEKIIKPIEKQCNDTLFTLTDGIYSISFDFTNGFDIMIGHKAGMVNVKYLSTSEKLRVGIAIQDVINRLTNARVLLIDDGDILDKKNAKLLRELLEKIEPNYDSIFVIATMSLAEAKDIFESVEDSAIYFIEDGRVESVCM